MYVEIDKKTETLFFDLPQEYQKYIPELNKCIEEDFAFEPLNNNTILEMNEYIINWFKKQGIQLPEIRSTDEDKD